MIMTGQLKNSIFICIAFTIVASALKVTTPYFTEISIIYESNFPVPLL